ncbi:MAG: YlcI/YnfO family protein [Thermoguttaceae bacterium]|jgi:hypothetical protein
MRTTIRINDELLAQAKEAAKESGCTLRAFIEYALRLALASKTRQVRQRRVRLPSSGSGGLRHGVNLDSAAELLDIMDGTD